MYCRTEMLSLLLRTWPRVACQTRAASKKPFARTAKVMKTYNQENKLMFGVLLESSLERNKRRNSKLPLSDDQTDINSPKNLSYESSSNSGPISFEQLTAAFEEELPLPKQKAAKKTAKTIKSTKAKKEKPITQKPEPIIEPSRNILHYPMVSSETTEVVEQPISIWKIPSVSKVLNATMSEDSRAALDRWQANLVAQLGEQGFQDHRTNLLLRGSQFHAVIHDHLSGKPVVPIPELEGCWSSLSKVLPDLGRIMNLESPVCHPALQYRGIIDCVAEFRGEPMVIEWKKSDKKKPIIQYTYDAPLQMTAYIGAINFDSTFTEKIKRGTVVVAYTDGSPADVFCLTYDQCVPYWQYWLDRLNRFKSLQ